MQTLRLRLAALVFAVALPLLVLWPLAAFASTAATWADGAVLLEPAPAAAGWQELLGGFFFKVIVPILFSVLLSVLSLIGAKVAAFFHAKTEDQDASALSKFGAQCMEDLALTVKAAAAKAEVVFRPDVQQIRADGKLTKGEAELLRTKAVALVKEDLAAPTLEHLQKRFGDALPTVIEGMLEHAVAGLKKSGVDAPAPLSSPKPEVAGVNKPAPAPIAAPVPVAPSPK